MNTLRTILICSCILFTALVVSLTHAGTIYGPGGSRITISPPHLGSGPSGGGGSSGGGYREPVYHKPSNVDIANQHFHRGNQYFNNKNFEAAVYEYREALRYSDWWSFHNALARSLHNLNRYNEAIEEYHLAIRSHPNDSSIWYWLTEALISSQRYTEAIETYKDYINRYPRDSSWAYNNVGVILNNNLKDPKSAELWYLEAIRLDHNYTIARDNLKNVVSRQGDAVLTEEFNRSFKLIENGDNKGAEVGLRKLLLAGSTDPAVLNNLGVALESQGHKLAAEAYFQKAASLDPNSQLYKDNINKIRNQSEYKTALNDLKAAKDQGQIALSKDLRIEAMKHKGSIVCWDDSRGCSFTSDHSLENAVFIPSGKPLFDYKNVSESVKKDSEFSKWYREKGRVDKDYKDTYESLQAALTKRDSMPEGKRGNIDIVIYNQKNDLTRLKSEGRVAEIEMKKRYENLGFQPPKD
jgi:tetratricopeptide (TPR) repeat protein